LIERYQENILVMIDTSLVMIDASLVMIDASLVMIDARQSLKCGSVVPHSWLMSGSSWSLAE